MTMNSAEFMVISPAAALCDQSADWSLARQEGFFPRHMSLEKMFGWGVRGGACDVYGKPASQRDGSCESHLCPTKNRPC